MASCIECQWWEAGGEASGGCWLPRWAGTSSCQVRRQEVGAPAGGDPVREAEALPNPAAKALDGRNHTSRSSPTHRDARTMMPQMHRRAARHKLNHTDDTYKLFNTLFKHTLSSLNNHCRKQAAVRKSKHVQFSKEIEFNELAHARMHC